MPNSTSVKPLPSTVHGAVLVLSLALTLPTLAQTNALRVASDVKDIRIKALNVLPKANGSTSDRADCPQAVMKPASAAAKQVAAQGWAVMADVPLGSASSGTYRAISFAGRLEAGTSATCSITQGNVAVFDNDKLVALAYGKSAEDTAIGTLTALEGGTVRVWDGDMVVSPVGDLRVDADGTVRLSKIADEDTVCHGRAKVPTIYGMAIDKARKALAAKGWKPVRGGPNGEPRQSALVKRGLVETENCAGTGLAYCDFSYTGPAGKLTVTTAGEDDPPHVVDYEVKCR